MSFRPKKKSELEIDGLNIKSHLNTSLDMEGISLSEDLINRTLNAIKQQEAKPLMVDKADLQIKKPIPLYRHTRTWITVVAAVLILVVGLNAAKMLGNMGMKKDMAQSEQSIDLDGSNTTRIYSRDESIEENEMAVQDLDKVKESDFGDKSIAVEEDAKLNEDMDTVDMFSENISDEIDETPGENNGMMSIDFMLTFTDIAMIEAADVSMITISSTSTGEMKTLTEQSQIDEFFKVIKKHLFMSDREEDTDTQYIVKLNSNDRESQIVVGEAGVSVDHSYNDIRSHSIYNTVDQDILLEDLKELLKKW